MVLVNAGFEHLATSTAQGHRIASIGVSQVVNQGVQFGYSNALE